MSELSGLGTISHFHSLNTAFLESFFLFIGKTWMSPGAYKSNFNKYLRHLSRIYTGIFTCRLLYQKCMHFSIQPTTK